MEMMSAWALLLQHHKIKGDRLWTLTTSSEAEDSQSEEMSSPSVKP